MLSSRHHSQKDLLVVNEEPAAGMEGHSLFPQMPLSWQALPTLLTASRSSAPRTVMTREGRRSSRRQQHGTLSIPESIRPVAVASCLQFSLAFCTFTTSSE
ncbi:hypothetical protein WJX74_010516 [Apatococcus lobatus]|uniref:Uncharacterized protein n=1 Tax=Apatococcus lobatus TaxID=904363 RepID=A0AAW1QLM8_9CHLO